MKRATWGKPISAAEVARRAGGRARYNRERQDGAILRRLEIVEFSLRRQLSLYERGAQAELARVLRVSRSTISRDVAKIMAEARARRACPSCGTSIAGLLPDEEAAWRAL